MTRVRISAFAMGALLLAACGDSEPLAPPPSVGQTKGVAPASEPPFAGADWSLIASGQGVALRLEEEGDLIAAIVCMRNPAGLRVESDRFRPVLSEDRFTIGAGDDAYALAANLEAVRERGVEASGDIPADLLDRIEAGGEIAFNYGAQNLGPFPVVQETDRKAFVAACRRIAG